MSTDKIEWLTPDDEYESLAKSQKDFAKGIALKIERSETLDGLERRFAAGALRFWADNLPLRQKRKRGKQPQIDPADVAIHYACMVNGQGKKKTPAIAQLAEHYGVTTQAIEEALKKYRDVALSLIPESPKQKK